MWEVMWGGEGVRRGILFSLSSCITSLTICPRFDWTENCMSESKSRSLHFQKCILHYITIVPTHSSHMLFISITL